MRSRVLVPVLLLAAGSVCCSDALAQSSTSLSRLMDDYYRETGKKKTGNEYASAPSATRSVLPAEMWEEMDQKLIGISDPSLDSADGYRQAYLRALMLMALQKKSTVKVVTENFRSLNESSKGTRSKYEEMYSVEAYLRLGTLPVVSSYFRLKSGETILLLDKVFQPDDDDSDTQQNSAWVTSFPDSLLLRVDSSYSGKNDFSGVTLCYGCLYVSCSLYHLETITDRSQHIFRTGYDVICPDSVWCTGSDAFSYTSVNGRWSNFASFFNGEAIPKPDICYFYNTGKGYHSSDSTLSQAVGMATVEGLWPALITGVLWQITGIEANSSTTVRQVSDECSASRRDLSRVVESHRVTFGLDRLAYASGRLYSVLSVNILYPDKQ